MTASNVKITENSDNSLIASLLMDYNWFGTLGKVLWDGTDLSYTFHTAGVFTQSDGGINASSNWTESEKANLRKALAELSAVSNLTFTEISPEDSDLANFDIRKADMSQDTSTDWSKAGAYTYGPSYRLSSSFQSNGEYYRNDVVFQDVSYDWGQDNPAPEGSWICYVQLHEFGHRVGLAHPHDDDMLDGITGAYERGDHGLNCKRYTVMSYNYDAEHDYDSTINRGISYYPSSFMVLDIAAIQYLYGADMTAATGNNIYKLDDVVLKTYKAIWDAAGNDTMQYNGNKDVVIDLRAGHLEQNADAIKYEGKVAHNYNGAAGYFSGLYDGAQYDEDLHGNGGELRGGYYIANGVVIENATGGSGNDRLIGNEANNVFMGRAGNDTYVFNFKNHFDQNITIGHDTIIDTEGNNIIKFNCNIIDIEDDLSCAVNQTKNELEISIAQVGYITIKNWVLSTGNAISSFVFVDVIYSASDFINMFSESTGKEIIGDQYNNTLIGTDGDDKIYGLGGDDTLIGGAGADLLDGGEGYDYASYQNEKQGVIVNLNDNSKNAGAAAGDVLVSIENVKGTEYDDVLYGSTTGTTNFYGGRLHGLGGDDRLYGGDGVDRLYGGSGNDRIYGYNGNDHLNGGSGDDYLYGDSGNDRLYGVSGNDYLSGGSGDDYLYGDSGNDQLYGGYGNDYLNGGTGDDYLSGWYGDDTYAFDIKDYYYDYYFDYYYEWNIAIGNNTIDDTFGNNIIKFNCYISDIEDDLSCAYNQTKNELEISIAQVGYITIKNWVLSEGNAISSFNFLDIIYSAADFINMFSENTGKEIIGDQYNNTLTGTDGDDKIYGLGGNDTLTGGAGADLLDGGEGADYVSYRDEKQGIVVDLNDSSKNAGAAAGDVLVSIENVKGTEYDDIIYGSNIGTTDSNTNVVYSSYESGRLYGYGGNDILYGGNGQYDQLYGGDGDDILIGGSYHTINNQDRFYGGNGNDTIYASDSDFNYLYGENGDDKLYGGKGNDYFSGGEGKDYIDGKGGYDEVSYYGSHITRGIVVDLLDSSRNQGEAANDTLISIEDVSATQYSDIVYGCNDRNVLHGRGGDDILLGRNGNDTLYGNDGNDYLYGGNDNDYLYGHEGNDRLYGGSGDDQLSAGVGSNYIDGGSGFDLVSYSSYQSGGEILGITVDLQNSSNNKGQAAIDTLVSIEGVIGTAYQDYLYGSSGANRLEGRDGDDILVGRQGDDLLWGLNGSDDYIYYLGDGADKIRESEAAGDSSTDRILFQFDLSDVNVSLSWVRSEIASYGSRDLCIDFGSGDSVTVQYWKSSDNYQIEEFVFNDGTYNADQFLIDHGLYV